MENEKIFTPIKLELNHFTNEEIHTYFGGGIKNIIDYNYCLNKYGQNIINFKGKSFIEIFIEQMMTPIYLYQIFSILIWFYNQYYIFACIALFLILIILTVNSKHQSIISKNIQNFSIKLDVKIKRQIVNFY